MNIVHQPKLVGTPTTLVHIDESYFRRRRMANRGRLLLGDLPSRRANSLQFELDLDSDEEEVGTTCIDWHIAGPWVVGMCSGSKDVRFMIVPDRSRATLHGVLEELVERGSVIWTDEWAGYRGLDRIGYVHQTVNHSERNVEPITGANTQTIRNRW